jgi:3-deoxy-D-manno-octulosonic-acid transferase
VSLELALYRAAMGLAEPFAAPVLAARARRGKEDPARLAERLGHAGAPRPDRPMVWLHAVSVGEAVSLLPLVERLQAERPDLGLLVTTGTRTSAEVMATRLPEGVIHQYAPIDAPGAVARFLGHWRPAAGFFVESELWPNLILGAKAGGVRLGLISARMTDKSAAGWRRRPAAARAVLSAFELILAQDDASAVRLEALGGHVSGRLNLKRLGAPLAADEAEVLRLKAIIGQRPVVLAASTHAGEDRPIAEAVRRLAGAPLLILAPRHPERAAEVEADLKAAGFTVTRRTAGAADLASVDIYLADTLGEMGLLYRLADIAVMGGGFASGVGGHNPLEAALLGVGVVSGRDVFNFEDIYRELAEVGGAVMVDAPGGLAVLGDLVGKPAGARLGHCAKAFADGQDAGLEAAWPMLAGLLP